MTVWEVLEATTEATLVAWATSLTVGEENGQRKAKKRIRRMGSRRSCFHDSRDPSRSSAFQTLSDFHSLSHLSHLSIHHYDQCIYMRYLL